MPSVFVHGGSALPGQMPGPDGRDLNVVDTYETIGQVLAGTATERDLEAMSRPRTQHRGRLRRGGSPPTPWAW